MTRSHVALALIGVVAFTHCRCSDGTNAVKPSVAVTPKQVDFGPVKVGERMIRMITLKSETRVSAQISDVRVEGSGAAAFRVDSKPGFIASLGADTLTLSFAPSELAGYVAKVVIVSNDAEKPEQTVTLSGEGAKPIIEVKTECPSAAMCMGTATQDPLSIVYPAEPLNRAVMIDVTRLPSVTLTNEGPVALKVSKIAIEGVDAAAFSIAGNGMVPSEGLTFEPSAGVNMPIRFKPTSSMKTAYSAELVIDSDDLDKPRVVVALVGTLLPNSAPKVCANLIRVKPADDLERDYSAKAQWDPLLLPPSGGYDFRLTRDVEPRSEAIFSAISDAVDMSACTSDVEDGRAGLTYQWEVTHVPAGAPSLGISGANTFQATVRPVVIGEYALRLTVTDSQLASTVVNMAFSVAIKQDLVAEVVWPGYAGVDLDLHLIRPSAAIDTADPFSGAFDFFNGPTVAKTSGDMNGYARLRQKDVSGFNFDWGDAGTADDPRLSVDDLGMVNQFENVSLNYPENDAKCASSPCRYKVMVHYYADARANPTGACTLDGGVGSRDGEAANCPGSERCVADSAPIGSPALGSGKCYDAPRPSVRIYLKGNPVPAKVVPLPTLMPADQLALGSACQMLYVADVVWPSKTQIGSLPDGGSPLATIEVKGADGTGRVANPSVARFGYRPPGGNAPLCSPDSQLGPNVDWFTRQP
ncbi:MAG: choice-of-anchor D domain-containing protein [Myxococcaceae bacterium]|nr:choice-of-anchor D domain-containing protein [Myxococcaceae bacterium]